MSRPRVAIVGGGFAGMAAAKALEDGAEVTLIDRRPDFEFLPNLHEIVSGRQSAKSIRLPRARILRELGHTTLLAEAEAIDLPGRQVLSSVGKVDYDALILAPGAETQGLGAVPGAGEHALPIRSAEEAERIAQRLRALASNRAPARVVVVGGGLTGVEVLGEILRRHRKKQHLDLALIEAGPRLLSGWPKVLDRRIRKLAKRQGVEVILEARVESLEADSIRLDNGRRLASALTIWATGTGPPQVLTRSGLASRGRGLLVNEALNLASHPEVFVAGDAAAPPGKIKKQAAQALLIGARAGKNVARYLAERPLKAFQREPLPVLLTFGDLSSFVVFDDDRVLEGAVLEVGRDLAFQLGMAELDRLAAPGSLERLSRRFRHAKALRRLEEAPWDLWDGWSELRLHEP